MTTITDRNTSSDIHAFNNNNKMGVQLGLTTFVIVCPNSECREFAITASLFPVTYRDGDYKKFGEVIHKWKLRPQSSAKPFPQYIPEVLRQDYEEACSIVSLSPKASATLARRCLQGMIRDFWKIQKARLVDEIAELSGKVDSSTWEAIDSVRSIGNIGAHMEKDINLIIDVEPDEAVLLIRLVEVLFEEWYVHRHEREVHMKKLVATATAKAAAKTKTPP